MAIALGWQGHVDTNLSFSAFFDRDHTYVMRFMPQFPNAYEGPLIAENGSGTLVVGQGDWHQDGEGNKILVMVGSRRRNYPARLVAGQWYHLAVRVTVSAQNWTVEPYLDGKALGAGMTVPRTDPGAPKGTVRFGKRTTGQTVNGHNAQYFGFLDDAAVFSKALTPVQISALATAQSRLTGNEGDLLTGFNLSGGQVPPKLAGSVTLHGYAQRIATSPTYSSAADAPLLPLPTQNKVMHLPFTPGEEWLVVNGIETAASHHVGYASFCWDFVLAHEPDGNGGTYPRGTGGAPLFATAAGRISGVEESNPSGTSKPNIVHLEQAPGEHAGYLHVQQNSVRPALGDRIGRGERIASAGSTGMINPDANHLHFGVSDQLDGTPGFVTTPSTFSRYDVKTADGGWRRVFRGIPVAGEVVRVPPYRVTGGAAGDPRGYVALGVHHIVTLGRDGNVYELYIDGTGEWVHNVLTDSARAPKAAGRPFGYEAGGVHHVVYRGMDGQVHELFINSAGNWVVNTISAAAGAPKAAGDPQGYTAGGVHHVVYRGVDGQVQELFINSAGRWVFNTISAAAGAPKAAGDPFGYVSGGVHHVVYRGVDGQVQELFINSAGRWVVNTISAAAGAPAAAGDPHGYEAGGVHHVVYRGVDGQVQELFVNSAGRWVVNTISAAAGAPKAAGDPFGYLAGGVHHVVYRGVDGQVQELFINSAGRWVFNTVSAAARAAKAAGDPHGYVANGVHHIVYRGVDDHVQELFINSAGAWAFNTVSDSASAP